jgi:predicted nuclease of predicted toxin-antitoxin system
LRFKLDENISKRAASLLDTAGHDVSTVLDEELSGAQDKAVLEAAVAERRALITLDRDFGNVLRFPPAESHGIVVLETSGFTTPESIEARVRDFLGGLEAGDPDRELWIVGPGRIRVHDEE